MIDARRGFGRSLLRAVAVLCIARAAAAQARSCASGTADLGDRAQPARWTAALARAITVHMRDTALRDAIDRVAAVAKVRISYSPDLLPLDRAVCVSANAATLGSVLTDLLAGGGIDLAPVVGGADQIVLTPRVPTVQPSAPQMAPSVGVLDRVVVTGSVAGSREREITVGLDVISGHQLARENTTNLSTTLDSYVPGVWSWSQSPSNLLTSYGSIRGASSFGLSYPKVYIDGIEVANPLLVSRFAPDAIDRIEVIRGPQGSALYGTDAISGVINIVTRHEGANGAGNNASVRSSAGVTQSEFAHSVLRQETSASLVAGTATRSTDLNITASSLGDFVPDGHSRSLAANGSLRIVGARTALNGTARFFMEDAGRAPSPLLPVSIPTQSMQRNDWVPGSRTTLPAGETPPATASSTAPQSVREYTVGATGTFAPNDEWTHSLVAGIDGYSLANVQTNLVPLPRSVLADPLRDAQGHAARLTLRLSSVLHAPEKDPTGTTYTFSLEQASLRGVLLPDANAQEKGPGVVTWQNSTGATIQANTAINNTFFLTAGFRVQYDSRLIGLQQFAGLPMLGAAAVRDVGPFTVKLRSAYGKGIRPRSTLGHSEFWQTPYGSGTQQALGAETQEGTEIGVDVLAPHASLQVTRFDQRASGLIQQVVVPADDNAQSHHVAFLLENVGEIANKGWEIEASSGFSRLTASGTLSFVDSRVMNLATGYTGDLMTGDRMLQVPATTGGLNLSWLGDRWFASVAGTRALNWINYDEVAIVREFTTGARPAKDFVGPQLRPFWMRYDGPVRLRASASHDFRNMFVFEIQGDNLLNHQRGEPDNVTVVPGRTFMTGVKVKF